MAAITLHNVALTQMLQGAGSPVTAHLQRIAERTRSGAQRRANNHRRTGELADHIGVQPVREAAGPSFDVVATAPHASAFEQGAKPHRISARNVGSLHFYWEKMGGLETFVPRQGLPGGRSFYSIRKGNAVLIIGKGFVNHPGTAPHEFLFAALQEVIRQS